MPKKQNENEPLKLIGTFDPSFFEKRRISQPTNDIHGINDIITRPFTCIDVREEEGNSAEVLVGSADHAAYTFSAKTGRGIRRLYDKRFGHRDWVSSCCFLLDGRAYLTGGNDGKLCLWSRRRREEEEEWSSNGSSSRSRGGGDRKTCGNSCRDLNGEQHSVSRCMPLWGVDGFAAVSSGYDGSMCIWNVGPTGSSPLCVKIENKKKSLPPITDFAISKTSTTALSCSRDGLVSLWDLASGTLTKAVAGKHRGHVSSVMSIHRNDGSDVLFATAGKDGIVGIWDSRIGRQPNNPIGSSLCSYPTNGKPLTAMVEVKAGEGISSNCLLAGCVDGSVSMLDIRRNLLPLFNAAVTCLHEGTFKNQKAVFVGQENGVVSAVMGSGRRGGIDGRVEHILSMKEGAARLIASCGNKGNQPPSIIVSGDDGKAVLYSCPDCA